MRQQQLVEGISRNTAASNETFVDDQDHPIKLSQLLQNVVDYKGKEDYTVCWVHSDDKNTITITDAVYEFGNEMVNGTPNFLGPLDNFLNSDSIPAIPRSYLKQKSSGVYVYQKTSDSAKPGNCIYLEDYPSKGDPLPVDLVGSLPGFVVPLPDFVVNCDENLNRAVNVLCVDIRWYNSQQDLTDSLDAMDVKPFIAFSLDDKVYVAGIEHSAKRPRDEIDDTDRGEVKKLKDDIQDRNRQLDVKEDEYSSLNHLYWVLQDEKKSLETKCEQLEKDLNELKQNSASSKKLYSCSRCHMPGHTAKTCQVVPDETPGPKSRCTTGDCTDDATNLTTHILNVV